MLASQCGYVMDAQLRTTSDGHRETRDAERKEGSVASLWILLSRGGGEGKQ
jgi:hypothetical protein